MKKKYWLFLILIVMLVCGILYFVLQEKPEKQSLDTLMEEVGRDFYENHYYAYTGTTLEERKNLLSKYSKVGIKITIQNLDKENKTKIETFIQDSKMVLSCDENQTRVIIYPKEPFEKDSYDMKVELKCENKE